MKYGVPGEIAPWYDSDGNLILTGGATQYSTPLNGINLKTIGVVFLRKK